MKIVSTENVPAAIGAFSQAVVVNDILYVSGQIPIDPATGVIVEEDIKEQTEQVIYNIIVMLKVADSNISRVVKTACYFKNIDDFAVFNEIFSTVSEFIGIGKISMAFIYTPYIETAGDGVDLLSTVDGQMVNAQQRNILVTVFHPELSGVSVHEYFLDMVKNI